jgi:hypothetical protein
MVMRINSLNIKGGFIFKSKKYIHSEENKHYYAMLDQV